MPEPKKAYFEDVSSLVITCPHEDAFIPDGRKIFYRIIKSESVDSNCFLPTPVKDDRPLPDGFDDCIGKSVSVYDDLQGMINGFFKVQAGKKTNRTIKICQLRLCETDGVLKQTFDNKNHHSWWRSQAFSIASVTLQEIEI
ncbi:MAG TPA: hypothetical protein PKD42_17250 [Chitinophagaceae bacterium]|jgi:hypothetical protein|nr:hypothetical protein [Chitinophagaceae bacterium]